MKRFINYLDQIQSRKKLTKVQIYFAAFGILLFLTLALTIPNYILRHQQTMRGQAQQAPSLPPPPPPPGITNPPSPVTLGAVPASANAVVGDPFSIDVVIDGGGQQFNAAEATVTVSANLSVTGVSTPATNPCNFVYTDTPATTDPSFAGAKGSNAGGSTALFGFVLGIRLHVCLQRHRLRPHWDTPAHG